jgi:hypothetical protein
MRRPSKSDAQNAEEILIRFRQYRGCVVLIQTLKHPRSSVKQEQALRSGVYENNVFWIGIFEPRCQLTHFHGCSSNFFAAQGMPLLEFH